jgi:hypothetical protein
MLPILLKPRNLTLAALAATALGLAGAAIADQQSLEVERTAKQPSQLRVNLSKDVYRQESYQDSYTVDVPYQEEETYTEQVPYTDTETYTEQEPYQETQNVCRDVTDYEHQCQNEQVCQDVPKQECQNEQLCQDVPKQECRNEQECRDVPRQECHNEQQCQQVPRQECHNEEQCENGQHGERNCRNEQKCETRYENECRNEQRCENRNERECNSVPRCETHNERECRNEQKCTSHNERECRNEQKCVDIPHTRHECHDETVTKYRDVTKTREVTKYRDETRTRTVTKYRQEERCCETKYRDVFDHTYLAKLDVNFPAEATLDAGEREVFLAQLNGNDADAKVSFAPEKTLYGYGPADIQQRAIDQFEVTMKLVPKYKAADLGQASITKVALDVTGAPKFTMNDAGGLPKVATTYDLQVVDPSSGAVLASLQKTGGAQTAISWDLPALSAALTRVHVKLAVARTGIVIDGPVQFLWENDVPVQREQAYDPKPYLNKDLVNSAGLTGKTPALNFTFRDQTKVIPQVHTEYEVKLSVVAKTTKTIADKTLKREALQAKPDGTVSLALAKDLGVSSGDLKGLASGTVVALELRVLRYGSRFSPSPSVVTVTGKLKVK